MCTNGGEATESHFSGTAQSKHRFQLVTQAGRILSVVTKGERFSSAWVGFSLYVIFLLKVRLSYRIFPTSRKYGSRRWLRRYKRAVQERPQKGRETSKDSSR